MEERYRIMARIPPGQGEPPEVIRVKTVSDKVHFCHDPDTEWYKDNVPCRRACPAETRIPEYINAAAVGDFDKCYEINFYDNVLPHTLGRVCAHPCEAACRHAFEGMGESVSICWLKRSGADHKKSVLKPAIAKSTGKKVAVIGSGPAGLALALDLTLWGHKVTIYEGMEKPGGMLRYGIPRFRLPASLIDEEINQILSLGVKLECNAMVGESPLLENLTADYDAVIMAGGSTIPRKMNIPGEEAEGVVMGLDFMRMVNTEKTKEVKGNVIVLGGGFTAMDCARSAYRLGAESVTIVYRRSRNELKVDDREIRETSIEGTSFIYLMSPHEIKTVGGHVNEIVFIRNRLGEPGADGRRGISPIEGSETTMKADWVLAAISQSPDTGIFGGKFSFNKEDYSTSTEKVFATGDYVTGPRDIITAIGNAHKTARSVDSFLTGRDRFEETVRSSSWEQRIPDSYKGWKSINGNIFDLIPRLDMPGIELSTRRDQLKEVDTGYDGDQPHWQGERCYLCNHNIQIDEKSCILCYNCVDVCPYDCILMLQEQNVHVYNNGGEPEAENKGSTYMIIAEENCVRCGLCIDACPVPCITMEKMEIERVFKG